MRENGQYRMRLFCEQLLTLIKMYSLQARDRRVTCAKHKHILKIFHLETVRMVSKCRRASSGAVRQKLAGSMAVEAAFVVPLFIFCIVNLLFAIQIVETSSRITAAIHETGNEICSYGYAIENGLGESVPLSACSTLYASSLLAKHLGPQTDRRGGIKGGISGINYLGTSIMSENGIVKISTSYRIKYPFNMCLKSLRLGTSYYGHAWIGYEGNVSVSEETDEDPIVFITPSGSVYHTDMGCSHLNPSTSAVSRAAVVSFRNKDGSKYHACEICGSGCGAGDVYITDYGNRYHSNLYCSGIKRNIQSIHLSEVGGRRECMTCGGQ